MNDSLITSEGMPSAPATMLLLLAVLVENWGCLSNHTDVSDKINQSVNNKHLMTGPEGNNH